MAANVNALQAGESFNKHQQDRIEESPSPSSSEAPHKMGRMKSSPQANQKSSTNSSSNTGPPSAQLVPSTGTKTTKEQSQPKQTNPQASSPILHIAASETPSGTAGGGGVKSGGGADKVRRVSNTAVGAATSSKSGGSKPCCFCWCCCYRCTCLSSRNREEELSKSRDITSRDSWSNDPDVTPSVEEIRCWGDSFDRLMKSPMGRAVFREFLKCEYSEENILFWLACEDLKKDNNPEVVEEKARLIYEDYISILSPKEVSLDSRVREIVNRNMVDPTPHTFDEAQLQIYTLMHRDSYPRFVNSSYYKKLAQLSNTSRKESSA